MPPPPLNPPLEMGLGYATAIQPDQMNMAVYFWYLVKSDLSNIRHVTAHTYAGQVTFYKLPETHGHVELVTLYIRQIIFFLVPKKLPQLRGAMQSLSFQCKKHLQLLLCTGLLCFALNIAPL